MRGLSTALVLTTVGALGTGCVALNPVGDLRLLREHRRDNPTKQVLAAMEARRMEGLDPLPVRWRVLSEADGTTTTLTIFARRSPEERVPLVRPGHLPMQWRPIDGPGPEAESSAWLPAFAAVAVHEVYTQAGGGGDSVFAIHVSKLRFYLDAVRRRGGQSMDTMAVERFLATGAKPQGGFVLSVDDNFASNQTVLRPLLEEFGQRAFDFVHTDSLGAKDRRSPIELRADWDSGVFIPGVHSASHARLDRLWRRSSLDAEIAAPRAFLSSYAESAPTAFAYPFGIATDRAAARVAAAGYRLAFEASYTDGWNTFEGDPFRLRRAMLLDSDRWEEMLAKAGFLSIRLPDDPVIVDDADPDTEFEGTFTEWVASNGASAPQAMGGRHAYGRTLRVSTDATSTAEFQVRGLRPGRWAVWAHWDPKAEHTGAMKTEFFPSGADRPAVAWSIDQTKGTGGWNRLGDWVASSSRPLGVRVHSGDGKPFVADAFLFQPIELAPHDPIIAPGT